MMDEAAVAFLGDTISAQGFRLAGASAATPAPGEELDAFESACASAAIVLLAAAVAEKLPEEVLEAARIRERPLVLLLPPGTFGERPYGSAVKARRILGLEA